MCPSLRLSLHQQWRTIGPSWAGGRLWRVVCCSWRRVARFGWRRRMDPHRRTTISPDVTRRPTASQRPPRVSWVATQGCRPCLPATDTFNGISVWKHFGSMFDYPFETCYQYKNEANYCWSKSTFCDDDKWSIHGFFHCAPNNDDGTTGNFGGDWNAISAEWVNPVTHPNSCGPPCQGRFDRRWTCKNGGAKQMN